MKRNPAIARNLYRIELNRFLALEVDIGPCAGFQDDGGRELGSCHQNGTELVTTVTGQIIILLYPPRDHPGYPIPFLSPLLLPSPAISDYLPLNGSCPSPPTLASQLPFAIQVPVSGRRAAHSCVQPPNFLVAFSYPFSTSSPPPVIPHSNPCPRPRHSTLPASSG